MTMAPLLGELRGRVGVEVERRMAEAREEASRLITAARQRTDRAGRQAVERRRRELARVRDERLDAARQEAGRVTLAARERLISRVLACVRQRAPALAGDARAPAWLARTVEDALGYLPEGPVIVQASDPRAGDIVRQVAGDREARVAPLAGTAGVIVSTGDGRVRVDATLEQFLRAEGARLSIALVACMEEAR